MSLPSMTAQELHKALKTALRNGSLRNSDALVKNGVGNLAVERKGRYIGFIDLRTAEVVVFDEDDDEEPTSSTV